MPRISYTPKKFNAEAREIIDRSNLLIGQYAQQGYTLSLRQLYYQHVARGWIPNKPQSYAKLGNIISDARLAGEMDWLAIEDRGRSLKGLPSSWTDEKNILEWARDQYKIDRWAYQKYRCEVWVEKDALLGVVERPCEDLYVSYFSCRGYNSQSEMWLAAQRFIDDQEAGLRPVLIHLGDHDPSGIDMSRDIQDRLATFGADVSFRRIALNMDQVRQYQPPPNPAKTTDSRYESYIAEYGDESWELDALDPAVLDGMIRRTIQQYINNEAWVQAEEEEREGRLKLDLLPQNWEAVVEYLRLKTQRPVDGEEPILLGPAGSTTHE